MEKLQDIMDLFIGNAGKREMASEKKGHLKKYDTAYQSGEYMMLSFTRVDSITGDLSLVDDDITVIMPADQITGKPYDLRFRAQKLEDAYCVKVTGIEPARKIVYVSHQSARLEKRPEIEAELQKYLSAKEKTPLTVKGKVYRLRTCGERMWIQESGWIYAEWEYRHLSISETGKKLSRRLSVGKLFMGIS